MVADQARSNRPALISARKLAHSRPLKPSTGPVRFLVSRTAAAPGSLSVGEALCDYAEAGHVINGYGDAVLLAPLRCKTIEPFIVLRHEMAPLQDL